MRFDRLPPVGRGTNVPNLSVRGKGAVLHPRQVHRIQGVLAISLPQISKPSHQHPPTLKNRVQMGVALPSLTKVVRVRSRVQHAKQSFTQLLKKAKSALKKIKNTHSPAVKGMKEALTDLEAKIAEQKDNPPVCNTPSNMPMAPEVAEMEGAKKLFNERLSALKQGSQSSHSVSLAIHALEMLIGAV